MIDNLDLVQAKILRLEPGDIIALRYEDDLPAEQARRLKEYGEAAFPGHSVVVLTGGVDLVVVREAEPI